MSAVPQDATTTAPSRKKKGGLALAGVVLVLLAGALGGWLLIRGNHGAAGAAQGASQRSFYLQLDPAFVVNFQDENALRFLQVGVNVMSHDQEAIAAAREADPEIRNALLMLFSAQDMQSLSDVKGKQKLQAAALSEIQRILREKIGRPGVDAVYFTSFIMQ